MLIRHNNIEFVNAQAMHTLFRETFDAPTAAALQGIKPGDSVKVCVNSERFWCTVTGVADGIITGRVDNTLVLQGDGLKYGDLIGFPADCVYAIL